MEITIRLGGISKHYSGVAVLSDVSVEFYAGEVHAVLGENGAGVVDSDEHHFRMNQPDTGEIDFEPCGYRSCRRIRPALGFRFPISTPQF
jgi:ribose transport system ATP-binding protein